MARVLVVEDEPNIAMILQEILGDEGHEVTTAGDGNSALKRLSTEPAPDVALVDLFLPKLSGKRVIEQMRADPALRRVPVVIMSGAIPTPEVMPPKGTYEGYLTKPFDLVDVVKAVSQLVRSRAGVPA